MMKTLFYIGTGSFIGGVARYLLSRLIQNHTVAGFPWGTFVVNVAGSFVIGLLYALFERGNVMDSDLRLFLTVGFCGGFTTFSTFVHENYLLIGTHNFICMAGYTALSFLTGMGAVCLGYAVVRIL